MEKLPLFVLPMVLLPGEVQELRVFEPRYKQMLDDCLLDNKNFGLVRSDYLAKINNWDGPMEYGCEAEIIHHETKGSNHFLEIIGRRRFTISKVHQPALPPFSDPSMSKFMEKEGIYPDLESLIDAIPEDVDSSKLYISGDVDFIESSEAMNQSQQIKLEQIVRGILNYVGIILRVDDETFSNWIQNSPIIGLINDQPESIYVVSAMLMGDLDLRQEILEAESIDEVMNILSMEIEKFSEEE